MATRTRLAWLLIVLPLWTQRADGQTEIAAPWKPTVAFSTGQARSCVVEMGDQLPSATLPQADGGEFDLGQLADDALTVVAFWNDQNVGGVQLSRTISRLVGPTDARLITICVGDDRQQAARIAEHDAADGVVHLIDNGALWKEVSRADPPRVFLVRGREILWMDIEYSPGTQSELVNAIRYFTANPG